jgi:hypothetical protein
MGQEIEGGFRVFMRYVPGHGVPPAHRYRKMRQIVSLFMWVRLNLWRLKHCMSPGADRRPWPPRPRPGACMPKKIEILSQARSPEHKEVRNPSLPACRHSAAASRCPRRVAGHASCAARLRPSPNSPSAVPGSQRRRCRVLSQRPAPSPVAQLPKRGLVPAASAVASPSPRPLPARRPPAARPRVVHRCSCDYGLWPTITECPSHQSINTSPAHPPSHVSSGRQNEEEA